MRNDQAKNPSAGTAETSIGLCSTEVQERLVPGHWEGGPIKRAKNRPQIGMLVERKTLFTVLIPFDNAMVRHAAQHFDSVVG